MITTRLKINPQKQSEGVAALSLLRQSEGADSVLTAIQKKSFSLKSYLWHFVVFLYFCP